ncbi:MAG: nuclear transport factor 2 family protein [Novosphingobium sp.]
MTAEDRLAKLEARLQELTDRELIFDCIKSSSRGTDRFDVELVASCYHPDAIHDNGVRQVKAQGYGNDANAAHDMLFDAHLHNVTMQLCKIDGDEAHAESYSLGIFLDKGSEAGRILAGRYIDRLEKRDGEWRIALRRATIEIALEGKAALPFNQSLAGSNYLKGDRNPADISYQRPLMTEGGSQWQP